MNLRLNSYAVIVFTGIVFEEIKNELNQLWVILQQLQNVVIGQLFQGVVPACDVESNSGVEVVEGEILVSNRIVYITD